MAKEKPQSKEDKAKARQTTERRITVTLPDGTMTMQTIGPVPMLRNGGVRKRYAKKKSQYASNTKARNSKMGGLKKKDEPKGHYKGLSDEKKAKIKPMTFMHIPGELRNDIYPSLLDEIEGRTLVFTNNPTGLVPGWPATVVPRLPIGLLSAGNKLIRKELLPLAYEKTEIQIRIVSAHLKSTDELHAWTSKKDAIPCSSLDIRLITKLSLTILLPCSFETIFKGQGINFSFLTLMKKLSVLRVRVQVHVSNPHMRPWTLLHTEVPTTTFTPFVTRIMTSLFKNTRKQTTLEFGDGVDRADGGLGSWVDDRADGARDQGWMENPRIGAVRPENVRFDRDTVAVPVPQAERAWGGFRTLQGTADAFTRFDPVIVDGEDDPVLTGDGDEDGDGVMEDEELEDEEMENGDEDGDGDGDMDDGETEDDEMEDDEMEDDEMEDEETEDEDEEMDDGDPDLPDGEESV